jgi:hypothetical protein
MVVPKETEKFNLDRLMQVMLAFEVKYSNLFAHGRARLPTDNRFIGDCGNLIMVPPGVPIVHDNGGTKPGYDAPQHASGRKVFKHTYENEVTWAAQNGVLDAEIDGRIEKQLVVVLSGVPADSLCASCGEFALEFSEYVQLTGEFFKRWCQRTSSSTSVRDQLLSTLLSQCRFMMGENAHYLRLNSSNNPSFVERLKTFKSFIENHGEDAIVGKCSQRLKKITKAQLTLTNILKDFEEQLNCEKTRLSKRGKQAEQLSEVARVFSTKEAADEMEILLSGQQDLLSVWNGVKAKFGVSDAKEEQSYQEFFVQQLSEAVGVDKCAKFVRALCPPSVKKSEVEVNGASAAPEASAALAARVENVETALLAAFGDKLDKMKQFLESYDQSIRSQKAKRFCCNQDKCKCRMAIGFRVGTWQAGSGSGTCQYAYKSSKDKNTFWRLFMPLLKFVPQFKVLASAELGFFKSSFYRIRAQQTIGLLALLREHSNFLVQSSHVHLSIQACSAAMGFFYLYAKPCLEHIGKDSYETLLAKAFVECNKYSGNALIDAVSILRYEAWAQKVSEGCEGVRSDKGLPVPPRDFYELRDVVKLDKFLKQFLRDQNIFCSTYKSTKFLKESSGSSMAELRAAFLKGQLGVFEFHKAESEQLSTTPADILPSGPQFQGRIQNNEGLSIPKDSLVFLDSADSKVPMQSAYRTLFFKQYYLADRLESATQGALYQLGYSDGSFRANNLPGLFMVRSEMGCFCPHESVDSLIGRALDRDDPGASHLAVAPGKDKAVSSANKATREFDDSGKSADGAIAYVRLLTGDRGDEVNLIGKYKVVSDARKEQIKLECKVEAIDRAVRIPSVLGNLEKLLSQSSIDEIEKCRDDILLAGGRTSPSKRDRSDSPVETDDARALATKRNEAVDAANTLALTLSTWVNSQTLPEELKAMAPNSFVPDAPPDPGIPWVLDLRFTRTTQNISTSQLHSPTTAEPTQNVKDLFGIVVDAFKKIEDLNSFEIELFKSRDGPNNSVCTKFICSRFYKTLRMCGHFYMTSWDVRIETNLEAAKAKRVASRQEASQVSAVLAEHSRLLENRAILKYYPGEKVTFAEWVQLGICGAIIGNKEHMKQYFMDACQTFHSYTDAEFKAVKADTERLVDVMIEYLLRLAVQKDTIDSFTEPIVQFLFSPLVIFCVSSAAVYRGTANQKRCAFKLLERGCNVFEVASIYSQQHKLGTASVKTIAECLIDCTDRTEYDRTMRYDACELARTYEERTRAKDGKKRSSPVMDADEAEAVMLRREETGRNNETSFRERQEDKRVRQEDERVLKEDESVVGTFVPKPVIHVLLGKPAP